MEEKFDVTGMTCAACQANVTRVVSKLDGVSHCDVSLLSNSMKVEFDQDKVNEQTICEAVKQIGYGASVIDFEFSFIGSFTSNCDGSYGGPSYFRGYGMDDGFSLNTADSMSIYIVYSKTFLYYWF